MTGAGFFPIGMNFVSGTKGIDPVTNWFKYNRIPFITTTEMIHRFSINGGNLMRIFMDPTNFDIEWEESGLGNYEYRQNRAFDLDEIFTEAERKHVYIQLCLSVFDVNPIQLGYGYPDETTWWDKSPYHQLVGNSEDFFRNSLCKKYYKRRLRYIMARWDYNPCLFGYEMFNEADHLISNFWSGTGRSDFYNWHKEMIDYMKPMSVPARHMFTTSVATPDLGNHLNGSGNPDQTMLYQLPQIDYLQDHFYSSNKETDYQDNYLTRRSLKMSPGKPNFLGEFGTSCGTYTTSSLPGNKYFWSEFHDRMWTSIMSGQGATALFFGTGNGNEVIYADYFMGGQEAYFLPVSDYMKDEDFTFYHGAIYPIANPCFGSDHLTCPRDDAPSTEPGSSILSSTEYHPEYISNTITTSDDDHVEVFGLKTLNKIYGWVHHKDNYWYNLPHANCDSSDPDPVPNPSMMSVLAPQITISNMFCDGMYKVEFYSTYPPIKQG